MTDVIETKLVETHFFTRWHCHVCGGHTEKVCILCEGDLAPLGLMGSIRVCERCLEGGNLDQHLNETARDLEEQAAFTRSLIGKIKTPTYAEWVEREYLANAACALEHGENVRNSWKESLRDEPAGTIREVLEKLVETPDADLASLIMKHSRFDLDKDQIIADLGRVDQSNPISPYWPNDVTPLRDIPIPF
jgi:hypothetical protein